MAFDGTRIASRKPIDGYLDYEGRRAHGHYSSKVAVPKLYGMDGKPVKPLCTVAPWMDPASQKLVRDALKGKQMATRRYPYPTTVGDRTGRTDYFGKLGYAPDPYDPKKKKPEGEVRKIGFGMGPGGRDDLSNVLEVGRYRHHLETEKKQEAGMVEAIKAEAARLREAQGGRPPTAPTFGMSTALPKFTHAFDRQNYVQEFTTKNDPRKKGERCFGPLRPTSADFGEGAFDRQFLNPPEHAVKPGTKLFVSHYARPSASIKTLMPIGL